LPSVQEECFTFSFPQHMLKETRKQASKQASRHASTWYIYF